MVYKMKSLNVRIKHAAKVIRSNGKTNRKFDSCFEMGDGQKVVNALLEMAKTDDTLLSGIKARFGNWLKNPS